MKGRIDPGWLRLLSIYTPFTLSALHIQISFLLYVHHPREMRGKLLGLIHVVSLPPRYRDLHKTGYGGKE